MKININTANQHDLQQIIHIGPKRAAKIMNRRPFKDVYELSNVLGLGAKRIKQILDQDKITV